MSASATTMTSTEALRLWTSFVRALSRTQIFSLRLVIPEAFAEEIYDPFVDCGPFPIREVEAPVLALTEHQEADIKTNKLRPAQARVFETLVHYHRHVASVRQARQSDTPPSSTPPYTRK